MDEEDVYAFTEIAEAVARTIVDDVHALFFVDEIAVMVPV